MIDNALIRRYAVSALRPRYLWLNIGMYAMGLGVLGMLNVLALNQGVAYEGDAKACLRAIYGQMLVIQFLLLWVWGGYGAGNALREEMLQKSIDFFRLLPLTPWQKLVGVAVGRNLPALALAVVTAVVHAVVGTAGQVPLALQAQIDFVLVSIAAVVWCVAVLSSVRQSKSKQQQSAPALLLLFLGLLMTPLLLQFAIFASSVVELAGWKVSFFGGKVPGLLLIGAVATYGGVWAAFGAMRVLHRAEVPLFSPVGAYRFLVGCLVIALGLVWGDSAATATELKTWLVYAAATHFLVVMIPFGLLRTYEQYMARTYDLIRHDRDGQMLKRNFLRAVNPVAWVGGYALWAAFVIGVAAMESIADVLWALALVVCVFFAWAVFLLLAELTVVVGPRNEKLKFFTGFLALLYLILPILLSSAMNDDSLWSFSYFGIWAAIGERASGETVGAAMQVTAPLLLNLMLVVMLVMFIWRRYEDIVDKRRSMLPRS